MFVIGAWFYLCIAIAIPWLWGPYAGAFLKAGPLLLSRTAVMIASVSVLVALLVPFMKSSGPKERARRVAATAAFAFAAVLSLGHYAHSIVHTMNLMGNSYALEVFAREVGFDSVEKVPQQVKDAFALSDKLSAEGKAPWLPRGWTKIEWPKKERG